MIETITSADVNLSATDGGIARVRATFEIGAGSDAEADAIFEASRLRVGATPGSLSVDEPNGHRGFGHAISRLLGGQAEEVVRVEVEAPAGCRLEVRVVNADVQATGFKGTQRYQSVSGDLRVVEVAGALDIDSVSGDVSLRAVAPVALKAINVSGDLMAEAPSFERVRVQSVSGDVSIDGALDASSSYAMDTVSGDVRLATPGSGMTVTVRGMSSDVSSALPHRLEGTPERRRLIVGDGAASVTFNSMSGDLAVVRSRQAVPEPALSTKSATGAGGRIEILEALERGEIDVDDAMRRLGGSS